MCKRVVDAQFVDSVVNYDLLFVLVCFIGIYVHLSLVKFPLFNMFYCFYCILYCIVVLLPYVVK